ncbi:MAG TPA: hypothetical protein PK370_01260 [Candidatus Woesebacteria bacterium]|nr:hypothetical protein [Candidatus Woesebacteria bacterium]HPJ17221.1 hypothetical protein [Candidatus Woesebacteria bacterium]
MSAQIENLLKLIPKTEVDLREHIINGVITSKDLLNLHFLGDYCSHYCENAGECDGYHCTPQVRQPITN